MQASRTLAQTIPVTISQFGYGTQIFLYGQPQTYTATLTVPAGSPVPQGSLLFENQTTILSTAALATTGTTQGSSLVRPSGDVPALELLWQQRSPLPALLARAPATNLAYFNISQSAACLLRLVHHINAVQ